MNNNNNNNNFTKNNQINKKNTLEERVNNYKNNLESKVNSKKHSLEVPNTIPLTTRTNILNKLYTHFIEIHVYEIIFSILYTSRLSKSKKKIFILNSNIYSDTNSIICCEVCNNKVNMVRYSTHLEKCLGKTKRAVTSRYSTYRSTNTNNNTNTLTTLSDHVTNDDKLADGNRVTYSGDDGNKNIKNDAPTLSLTTSYLKRPSHNLFRKKY